MLDLNPFRKNKINLEDYDYRLDIKHRVLLSQLSQIDLNVLEEILFNPLEIPLKKLMSNLDLSLSEIQTSLERLGQTGLFHLDGDKIIVNKEIRKYFESQIVKYEEDFEPDMEFLQNLLKKVPIHVLPTWYQIPRTSNNIFQSLLEKYLQTPQIFQRYLMELNLGDETLSAIVQAVFQADEFALPSHQIIAEYGLTREQFEEYMLHLEFNFVCCLAMKKMDDLWVEVVTPFNEWRQYLNFVRESTPKSIGEKAKIERFRPHDLSFIEDLSELVRFALERPLSLINQNGIWTLDCEEAEEFATRMPPFAQAGLFEDYVGRLIAKLQSLNLATFEAAKLYLNKEAKGWLTFPIEKRALDIYKNDYIVLISSLTNVFNERNLREFEKSLCKIASLGWVDFEDFMRGVTIPLNENSKVELKKVGRKWKYVLPAYSDEEKRLIETVVLNWLFESGLIALGKYAEKTCFTLTPLGKKVFIS